MEKNLEALQQLPQSSYYEKSYSHSTLIQDILVLQKRELLISLSLEGEMRFWIKSKILFEFVKSENFNSKKIKKMKTNESETVLFILSNDGKKITLIDLQTISYIKHIDLNFGIKEFVPFLNRVKEIDYLVVDTNNCLICLNSNKILIENVSHIEYVTKLNCFILLSNQKFIEYIDDENFRFVTKEKNHVTFNNKFETDLFFLKKKMKGNCINFEVNLKAEVFTIISSNLELFIFELRSGKLKLFLDISFQQLVHNFANFFISEKFETDKQKDIEQELIKKLNEPYTTQNFKTDIDEYGLFLIFPCFCGIVFFDIENKKPIKIIGKKEKRERFLLTKLYTPNKEKINNKEIKDSVVIATSFKKNKFCFFTKREPVEIDEMNNKKTKIDFYYLNSIRDISDLKNENFRNGKNERTKKNIDLNKIAIISTSLGEIHIKFFPKIAPKAVENFITHAKNGYYTNCIFHRVVPGYIQTGDPCNDGTGGESIWGKDFEDEISDQLKHDKPFTVSMANSGKNTNGSQFFITTIPSPWLDNKHTIFGRVFKGTDVVSEIEAQRTDNFEKPFMDIRILNIFII